MVKITTVSGSVYEFDVQEYKMRRVNTNEDAQLRKDEEWIKVLYLPEFLVGEPMRVVLEPLDMDADVTMRFTTEVVSVEEI